MPYNASNPPKKLKKKIKKRHPKATAKDIRKFIHVWNSVYKKTKDESKAYTQAWGSLKKKKSKIDYSIIKRIFKVANQLDQKGMTKESNILDWIVKKSFEVGDFDYDITTDGNGNNNWYLFYYHRSPFQTLPPRKNTKKYSEVLNLIKGPVSLRKAQESLKKESEEFIEGTTDGKPEEYPEILKATDYEVVMYFEKEESEDWDLSIFKIIKTKNPNKITSSNFI